MENLKDIPTRELLLGLIEFLPKDCVLHQHDIVSYVISKFDIPTSEIKEHLDIFSGNFHYPKILKCENGYYTVIPENKENVKKFMWPDFDERQLKNLEKLAKELIDYSRP